jgi:sec-independent protein translocase protein TatA
VPGPWEVVVILLILVIVFGAGRLSQIGGALGKTVREFRGAVQDEPKPATQAPVAVPPVTCPNCQASNVATNRFCSACGADLAARPVTPAPTEATTHTTNTCPSCATVNPAGQAFCGQCGTRLSVAA